MFCTAIDKVGVSRSPSKLGSLWRSLIRGVWLQLRSTYRRVIGSVFFDGTGADRPAIKTLCKLIASSCPECNHDTPLRAARHQQHFQDRLMCLEQAQPPFPNPLRHPSIRFVAVDINVLSLRVVHPWNPIILATCQWSTAWSDRMWPGRHPGKPTFVLPALRRAIKRKLKHCNPVILRQGKVPIHLQIIGSGSLEECRGTDAEGSSVRLFVSARRAKSRGTPLTAAPLLPACCIPKLEYLVGRWHPHTVVLVHFYIILEIENW